MIKALDGRILEEWTRATSDIGVPYYINHLYGKTQWDHPEYIRLIEEVSNCNSYKYAAYRTAFKLRKLQTKLKKSLALLLKNLAKIPEFLSEELSFGVSLVSATVESCFREIAGDIGITEEGFLTWLLCEPETLVWWTTLYRISAAEHVCHDIKCWVCKQHPIIGLRYQCLKCFGYNLCQDCFLHAKKSHRHKLSHPIQEYCHEMSMKEWRNSLIKMFKCRLKNSVLNQPRYLPVKTNHSTITEDEEVNCELSDNSGSDCLSSDDMPTSRTTVQGTVNASLECSEVDQNIEVPSSPKQEIRSVIMHLEDWHKEAVSDSRKADIQVTEDQTGLLELQNQIDRLKQVLEKLVVGKIKLKNKHLLPKSERLESTPIGSAERGLWFNLSPIQNKCENPADDTVVMDNDNKENHKVESHDFIGPLNPHNRQVLGEIKNLDHTQSPNMIGSISLPLQSGKKTSSSLPSFTNVNFSDLTSLTSPIPDSPYIKQSNLKEDEDFQEIKKKLHLIVTDLNEMLTKDKVVKEPGAPDKIVQATCEIGDALAEYVETVPSSFS